MAETEWGAAGPLNPLQWRSSACMISFNIRTDLKPLLADLSRLEREQVPFATARALTEVARQVAAAEQKALSQTFDRPTPFTLNAFGVVPATKASLTAKVFIRPIQSAYLAPYIDGGPQVLGSKRAILTPRDLGLNAYGNIARGKLASLKGRANVFVGTVKTKDGKEIAGVWERTGYNRAGKVRRKSRTAPLPSGPLKLLIQFTRPAQVTHRFPFGATAQQTIRTALPAAFGRAMAGAVATAK